MVQQVTKYRADDGREFNSEADCLAYEKSPEAFALVGLTFDQVVAAMERRDAALAAIIEDLGARIRRERQASGDKRRKSPKQEGEQE